MRTIISGLCLAAMASGFAASDAIAGHLLQTWWFIVPFVVATLVFIVLAGRFIKRL